MALQSFKDADSDEARQHLLDRRCIRKHPKRHRTRKRSLKQKAARKAKGAARVAANKRGRSKFLAASRAYWRGDRESHP